jgi:A/G-specific adenine glycosylase
MSGFSRPLLEWAAVASRDLPWRQTRDPWAVLVSEVMLQQTQVPRVVPRYRAFMDRFPTPAACARAPAAAVIQSWDGLGYNRRALSLHRAARQISDRHRGRLPDSLPELLELPGVGPYTARAILVFAFEQHVAVLDGNARRALSRLLGRPAGQADADALVPPGAAWAWNQAVLDLGAMICRPRPLCRDCPLAKRCAWQAAGCPKPDPWPRPRPQTAFDGSDRQARGRLIAALRAGCLEWEQLPDAAGCPDQPDRAAAVATALVAEGLAVREGSRLCLPGMSGSGARRPPPCGRRV